MKKKYIIGLIILILVGIISLVGVSYALFTKTLTGEETLTIETGTIKVDFEETNVINLNEAAPQSDYSGQKNTPYTFTITNTGTLKAYYKIKLEEDTINNTLPNYLVGLRLVSDDGYDSRVCNVTWFEDDGNGVVELTDFIELDVNESTTFKLYMWIIDDIEADNSIQGSLYQSKIVVDSQSIPRAS